MSEISDTYKRVIRALTLGFRDDEIRGTLDDLNDEDAAAVIRACKLLLDAEAIK